MNRTIMGLLAAVLSTLLGAPPADEGSPRGHPRARAARAARRRGGGMETVFRLEGEYWTVAYEGRTLRLKDNKGLRCMAHLLRHPGQEFHVADLTALTAGLRRGSGPDRPHVMERDVGPILDARARAEYKRRLGDLRDELEEATRGGDLGRTARARQEIELITEELGKAFGLGGRARKAGDPAERLRKAVTNQIRRSLEKICAEDPTLGRHLANALRTGVFCSYAPERRVAWSL